MKSIKEIENIKGKRILVRVDFNVPILNNKVVDDFRIQKAIPTINFLAKKGAIVILISHAGEDGTQSLDIIAKVLKKYVDNSTFIKSTILSDETEELVKKLKPGSVTLLENIRREVGEKKNDVSFARGLSRLGDIYVNDAFSVSHRVHASVVSVAKFLPSFAGLQLIDEVKHLSVVSEDPKHPFLFILGGAKFETKLPLIKKYLPTADSLFIGGALSNQVFVEQGYEVGLSLVEQKNYNLPKLVKNPKIILPIDLLVSENKKTHFTKPNNITKNEHIYDIGPETIKKLEEEISKAKLILWNGPLGRIEDGYDAGTKALLKAIAASRAISVIGGGDTVEIISKLKMEKDFTFVSTGGGATLEFLAKGTLPGIKALK
ncbi:MAG: phosphoglycerate kinase [Candidatus Nomurabacteria bacterium]|nr:phosphoglycerate kinase [Candidatus Nomurabacteria bacterium]